MLRVIVRTTDGNTAAHLGGPGTPIDVSYATFDIDAPALEEFLRQWRQPQSCIERSVVGVELLEKVEG